MPSKHREREDKYAAPVDLALPDLHDLVEPDGRVDTATHLLVNRYFDTADGRLRMARLTLRRRTGGPDAGWHLKVPAGTARTEVVSRSRSQAVPSALADVVLGVTRGQPLQPIAELTTERRVVRLLDGKAELLAEVADDRVRSTTLTEEPRTDDWREVEVELGPAGDEALLSAVGGRLRSAGAEAADYPSKLTRALGLPPVVPAEAGSSATLGDLVQDYVRSQCAEILSGDLALRLEEPQIHRTRVAIRRLRSTMRIYGELLDPEPTQRLEGELTWFAGLLGEVRDREVLLERLRSRLSELAPELVVGDVAGDLQRQLDGERVRKLKALVPELRSPRQLELLEAVTRWQTEAPFLEAAGAPAKQVRGYVDAARATMRRRLSRALTEHPDQEERLHRARKAAKRARYAAELALPVSPRAAAVVEEAKDLQSELGEHQDSSVSVAFLQQAGSRTGRNGFTYGVLLAQELQRAAALREALREAH